MPFYENGKNATNKEFWNVIGHYNWSDYEEERQDEYKQMDTWKLALYDLQLSVFPAKSWVVSVLMHMCMHPHTQTHTNTHSHQPWQTSFIFQVLFLSHWFLIFTAALESRKAGTSEVSLQEPIS